MPDPEPPLLEEYRESAVLIRSDRRMTDDLFKENGEFTPKFFNAENALVPLLLVAALSAIDVGGLDGAR